MEGVYLCIRGRGTIHLKTNKSPATSNETAWHNERKAEAPRVVYIRRSNTAAIYARVPYGTASLDRPP